MLFKTFLTFCFVFLTKAFGIFLVLVSNIFLFFGFFVLVFFVVVFFFTVFFFVRLTVLSTTHSPLVQMLLFGMLMLLMPTFAASDADFAASNADGGYDVVAAASDASVAASNADFAASDADFGS